MIYPSDFESKIGFDFVRNSIAGKCLSRMGKDAVRKMNFSYNFNEIKYQVESVWEMKSIIEKELPLPISNFYDIQPFLDEIKAEGSYTKTQNLVKVLSSLKLMKEIHDFFQKQSDNKEDSINSSHLADTFSEINYFPNLISLLNSTLNKFGEINDNATPELYEIRVNLRKAAGSVQRTIKNVLSRAISAGIVDGDTAPSIRDGRMVIPLPNSNKRSISGIIHDESATGKTVFIEPVEVVEASNRVRELELEEKREIVKILRRVSQEIRPFIPDMEVSLEKLGHLDFIRAKALFSIDINAEMPHLHPEPEIEWYSARHPGLEWTLNSQNKSIVPLNITLSDKQRILIISGPNAGGKSICLKTVAIVQYMLQCGLIPPVYRNSHMGIFNNVFIDIGDEQSIENDLSTYSSHLKNMKFFLSRSNSATLVLADEMGSGTEPQIGGALAQSILQQLGEQGCRGVVTTHYHNLKTFADQTEGFVNGAMLYDRQHLKPTFELSIGTAGSSFALDIASKIGLPLSVIENAKNIAGNEFADMEKYLSEITRDKKYWANKRQNIREKEVKLDNLLSDYEHTAQDLKQQRKAILNEAKKEAKEILDNVNSRIERTILEIRKAQAEKEKTKQLRNNIDVLKRNIENNEQTDKNIPEILNRNSKKKKFKENTPKAIESKSDKREFQVGDFVKLKDGNTTGQIINLNGKRAEVAFSQMRTIIDVNKLRHSAKPNQSGLSTQTVITKSTSDESRKRQLNFKNEIDVRGMRADEAIQAVTYFLDDAIQFGIGKVRILHGTGHGILKTLIREQLQANTAVLSFADEDVRFGGAGITVVNLE